MKSNISEATPEDWQDFWENEDIAEDEKVNDLDKNWGSPILGAPADY
tara:strand:+ start:996 stop:1136 length:141 start_codon:yes stop_codon:yes gene_type:complete